MAPHPIPLPCALALPPTSHQDTTTPSPCWAPHFMTQERLMFSDYALSEPHLSPAATMSDDMLSALTLELCLYLAACKRAFSEKPSSPMLCPCQRLHPVNTSHQGIAIYITVRLWQVRDP